MERYRRLLGRREYRLLWTGATISALGDGMSFLALVWLVLERTNDPALVGVLAAVYTAPVVVGGLAAGLILDRFDRRLVLIGDNAIRGLAMASVPVAAFFGVLTTEHLFVVAAIYGLLFMVSLAGTPSVIPTLVEEDELNTANAMETLSYGIAGLGGPALAGVAIALVSAPAVLAIDAATYGVFVLCLLAMQPLPAQAPAPVAADGGASGAPASSPAPSRGLGPAIRFVVATPAILVLTLMYMTINVGEGMSGVYLPIYARDVLGGDAATYGLLVTAFTAGILVGSLIVGAIGWRWPLGRSIGAGAIAAGLALGVLVLTPPLPVAIGAIALSGAFASSLTAWGQTIRMRLIPPELRGRVFALLRTLMQATGPIGAIIAGFLLAGGPIQPVLAVSAALVALPGFVGLVAPAMGRVATREPVAGEVASA
ncbi:MAG TPA: MFS transporter [Candidatus Limnocylindrales bacterium]